MARKRRSGTRSSRSTNRRPASANRGKRPAGARRKGRSRRRSRFALKDALLWFAAGLGLGLLALLPIYLLSGDDETAEKGSAREPASEVRPEPSAPEEAPAEEEEGPADDGKAKEAKEPAAESRAPGESGDEAETEQGYRFYTLLPEMEVEVPEPGPEKRQGAQSQTEAEPAAGRPAPQDGLPEASESGRFLVQVAAFRKRQPAEKLKARLALNGLQSRVVSADLGDKGTWHRVRLGPYPGRADAERVRDRLETEGMQGMILRK